MKLRLDEYLRQAPKAPRGKLVCFDSVVEIYKYFVALIGVSSGLGKRQRMTTSCLSRKLRSQNGR